MLSWVLLTIDRLVRWPLVLAWMALIFALSSIPNEIRGPESRVPYDKIAHFVEFGVLAFLVAWIVARVRGMPVGGTAAVIGVAAAVVYGVTDEWHQAYVPGRDPSWEDLATDAAGAVVGVVVAVVVSRMFVRRGG
jgi:VanZ family protein